MNLDDRLAKLRQQQKELNEALRQAEAKFSERQRKVENRAKFILGNALLAMPTGERDALLSMVLGRLTERDRQLVAGCLAEHPNAAK